MEKPDESEGVESNAQGRPGRSEIVSESSRALPSVMLLARMQRGETAARDELMRRYWPRLARWAQGRLPIGARDLYDTSDLVQETMMAALRRLDDFRPDHDGSLQAYLRTAILNRIRSLVRSPRTRGGKVEVDSAIVDPGPSPLEEAVGREAIDRYERAIGRLHADDRDLIHLKVELDLSYEEIAQEMGKPTIVAARKAVSRALYRLSREMDRMAAMPTGRSDGQG